MKQLVFVLNVSLALSGPVFATPMLQLDIAGGTYDATTETIVSYDTSVTLYAVLTPKEDAGLAEILGLLNTDYYISAAVVPAVDSPAELGSIVFNGTTVEVTEDMTYGVPPLELVSTLQGWDPGDLRQHGIFETYFSEFRFRFDSANTADEYNTALSPGGLVPNPNGSVYYAAFTIDVSGLGAGYGIHFDLYNEKLKLGDVDVKNFAPFSHDAEAVPEPTTMLLIGPGLAGLALVRGRRGLPAA